MKTKRKIALPALVLALVMTLLPLPAKGEAAPAQGADDIAALTTKDNGQPYYLMVDRVHHVVTAYGLDEDGYYTVPVKAMVCSVGKPGAESPLGTWTLSDRHAWCYMVDGSYGQYATRIYRGWMFHSVCYYKMDPSTLMTHEYNALGTSVSLGCVRLEVGNAKWIYDNCPAGTLVTIYDGADPGPLPAESTLVAYIDPNDPKAGWDPSDPRESNPWRAWMEENALPFSDVPFGYAHYADVRWAWQHGLLCEAGDDCFRPDDPLTWGEALPLVLQGARDKTQAGGGLWRLSDLLWLLEHAPAAQDRDEPITFAQLAQLTAWCETLLQHSRSPGAEWLTPSDQPVTRVEAVHIFHRYCTWPQDVGQG